MKKLIQGIQEFRKNFRPNYKETFARLALGQKPDVLFIGCSDSRVVPNLFASTDPGDLFVVRNVGNFVPVNCCEQTSSVGAAIEFSTIALDVKDIIVCGHSECGAMQALLKPVSFEAPNLGAWLNQGKSVVDKLHKGLAPDKKLEPHNQLSQLSVLTQVENLLSYPSIKKRVDEKTLSLHAWWFDIKEANVCAYNSTKKKFLVIE